MTTCQNLIDETKRYLYAGQREAMNQLTGAHNNSTTTFSLLNATTGIAAGAYLSVDLEIVYVWSVNESAKTCSVQRAMLGSTAATHADLSLVYVNAKFPDFNIFQALNADLNDLSASTNGLYGVGNVDLTYNAAISGYDLTGVTGIIDILRIRYQAYGPSKIWPEIKKYQLKIGAESSDFASTYALILYEGAAPGRIVRVTYSTPFTQFAAATDNVTVTGLPTTAYDIPPLGAAMRLVAVRETQRNFNEAQGDSRRPTEVPPGAQLQGMKGLQMMRQMRIRAESSRLQDQYPVRRRA